MASRRFRVPLLLLFLGAVSCNAPSPSSRSKGEENALAPALTFQASFLKDVLRKTCPPNTRVGTWAGSAMTDPIDGAAEEYLRLGALGLALAHTPAGEEILLFDMGTSEGAYVMYASLKDPGVSLAAGLASSGGCLVARKGRFLAQFPASWDQEKARNLADRLPGSTTRPLLFDALPERGLHPGSERILQGDPWGFGLFRWGLSGRYGNPPLSLAVLVPRTAPGEALKDMKGRLLAMGARILPQGNGFRGSVRGLGRFLFLPGPGKVVALTEIPQGPAQEKSYGLADAALRARALPPLPPWKTDHPGKRPEGKRERKRGGGTPWTLARVDRAIGEILERFIEDPKEPLPTDDLSGPWRLQVRASFQEIDCRPAGKGKGWDFQMKGKLGGKTWIHLEKDKGFRFKGWVRAMGGKGGFQDSTWPFSMVLARDGSELNGRIRLPGKKRGMDLQLVRPVHVKNHEKLKSRMEELLVLRKELLNKGKER